MTDSTLPLRGLGPEADEESEGAGARRPLLLAGGLAAALVLGAGGYLLMGGGSTDAEAALVTSTALAAPRTAPATSRPSPSASPAGRSVDGSFDEPLGRDPFRALYVETPPDTGTSAADPTVAKGSASSRPASPAAALGPAPVVEPRPAALVPAAPVAVPVAVPAAAAAPAAAGPASTTKAAGPTSQEHQLVLRKVGGSGTALAAVFTLDGRATTVKPGQSFGPLAEIRLISLQQGPAASQWTAVLQVGDGGPFDVVTGQAVSVR